MVFMEKIYNRSGVYCGKCCRGVVWGNIRIIQNKWAGAMTSTLEVLVVILGSSLSV